MENTFLTASPEVLGELVNYGSGGVQGPKGRLVSIQDHKDCSGFQEACPADSCRNRDGKGSREMGQMSTLRLKTPSA